MASGELDGWGVRGEGLDDHLPFQVAAAGAAGDLGEQLEGAFAGAEIGDVEAEVRIEDADEGDIGEVESLGNHLGADEDVDFMGFEGVE